MMTLPFVVSVPHCGGRVPDAIRRKVALDDRQVIESVDVGTVEIFCALPVRAVVQALWSRLVADLNRSPDHTGPKGVVALTDYNGRPIYKPGLEPDREEISRRVARFHRPYHEALERALKTPDIIGLIDGHSLNGTGPADAPDPGRPRKDVIISNNGDENGSPRPGCGPTACSGNQMQVFKRAFQNQGFSVALNSPYQGGYIVNHYGRQMDAGRGFAVQIEMNQDLYMPPASLEPDTQCVSAVARRVLAALEETAALLKDRFGK